MQDRSPKPSASSALPGEWGHFGEQARSARSTRASKRRARRLNNDRLMQDVRPCEKPQVRRFPIAMIIALSEFAAANFLKKMIWAEQCWAPCFNCSARLICPPAQARCSAPRRPSLRGAFFRPHVRYLFLPKARRRRPPSMSGQPRRGVVKVNRAAASRITGGFSHRPLTRRAVL